MTADVATSWDEKARIYEAGWGSPQPLPNSLPSVPEFEPELLPSLLSLVCLDVSRQTQAPIEFVAVAHMTALSSLLARHIAIRPLPGNEWTVVPNLWGLAVGRPASKKSPSFSAALNPIDSLEGSASEGFKDDLFHYENLLSKWRGRKKKADNLYSKGEAKWDSEADHLRQEMGLEPEPPSCTRYLVNDTTAEKLAEILRGNESVLLYRDELEGFFSSLDRHGQESARAFYLESWNGNKPFTVDRVGRGTSRIPRACVSVLGGTQPGPLQDKLRKAQQYSKGNDGLMQRFQLAVYPDLSSKFELVQVPHNHQRQQALHDLYHRFAKLEPDAVGASREGENLPFLTFDDDAQAVFSQWIINHENRLRSDEIAPCMESHLGKYQSLVASLALILHLAEGGIGSVAIEATNKAIAWAIFLEAHAHRIYAPVVGTDYAPALALARKIKAKKIRSKHFPEFFHLRDVYRSNWKSLSRGETQKAVEILEDFGWLKSEYETTLGRGRTNYYVNPLIWEEKP